MQWNLMIFQYVVQKLISGNCQDCSCYTFSYCFLCKHEQKSPLFPQSMFYSWVTFFIYKTPASPFTQLWSKSQRNRKTNFKFNQHTSYWCNGFHFRHSLYLQPPYQRAGKIFPLELSLYIGWQKFNWSLSRCRIIGSSHGLSERL